MNKFSITTIRDGKSVVSEFATFEAAQAAAEIIRQETGIIARIVERRPAQLLLTGHRLTLLVNGQPVAGGAPTKSSMGNLKQYLRERRDQLAFTPDCYITFPWLRDVVPTEDFYRISGKYGANVHQFPDDDFALDYAQSTTDGPDLPTVEKLIGSVWHQWDIASESWKR